MSKSKVIALVVLITFAFDMTAVGNAVAGENYKVRAVYYFTKWEQLSVPGEEKHIIALSESKGVGIYMEGKPFFDGWVVLDMSTADINAKTGLGSGGGYGE